MTPDVIEKFIEKKTSSSTPVRIHFKDRDTVNGIFIHTADYEELKSKNLWRIVNKQNAQKWKETKDESLARIFNGASFTRLSDN